MGLRRRFHCRVYNTTRRRVHSHCAYTLEFTQGGHQVKTSLSTAERVAVAVHTAVNDLGSVSAVGPLRCAISLQRSSRYSAFGSAIALHRSPQFSQSPCSVLRGAGQRLSGTPAQNRIDSRVYCRVCNGADSRAYSRAHSTTASPKPPLFIAGHGALVHWGTEALKNPQPSLL